VGAVETAGAGIMERLARAVEDAAREAAFVPETRPFRPHLTVARARRADRPRAPRSPFAGAAESEVRELGLYRSELLPGGARYTRLERFPLGAPAAPPPAEAGDRIA
jgi:2'-5' RNA ligase